jgi:hypothetical protein
MIRRYPRPGFLLLFIINAEKCQSHGRVCQNARVRVKRKVAIARFSNETKYGQSFFLDKDRVRLRRKP